MGVRLAPLLSLLLCGCMAAAIATAPKKTATPSDSAEAAEAHRVFWEVFHLGAHDRLAEAMRGLKVAYLANPSDPLAAAHIGFLHIWALAERERLPEAQQGPEITDHAVLARKFFGEAEKLAPDDARYVGFHAILHLTEGNIHDDAALTREGWFRGKRAIRQWPEFNLFTVGYMMSRIDPSEDRYRTALGWQWEALDRCMQARIDRENPVVTAEQIAAMGSDPILRRACANSWIAPHNHEGFFLNFGDMAVKGGDPRLGRALYAIAKQSPGYDDWAHKADLEARIRDADVNVERFRRGPADGGAGVMIQTSFACLGCHEFGPGDAARFGPPDRRP